MRRFQSIVTGVIACAMIAVGCWAGATATPAPTQPEPTAAPSATPQPTLVVSLRVPEVAETTTQVLYNQDRRASLNGRDTLFWPDGNIGFIPFDGKYRFFAANGPVIGRAVGTIDDPGASFENDHQLIMGVGGEFAYVAGGPVYLDPDTGLLLMFYHAERHYKNGSIFHAALGLAASKDDGESFDNLGIILETNATPSANQPCCSDMGGATYAIKDGQFYLYFRDRTPSYTDISLAVATAPVDEVVKAAAEGKTSPWLKFYNGGFSEPGISGRAAPLEVGNPPTDWFSVSYNTTLNQYIMAIATHERAAAYNFTLALAASPDGILWSPRVTLLQTDDELTYPSIIDPGGDPLTTGESFYIYYITTPRDQTRWHATPLHRMTVKLTGQMAELPHEWEFETDAGGWSPLNQIGRFAVENGALVVESTGNDPYMGSQVLGVSSAEYTKIEVKMKASKSGMAQFFFTSADQSATSETASMRFPISGSGQVETYIVDMSQNALWKGLIGVLRFDPTDQQDTVTIESIRLLP